MIQLNTEKINSHAPYKVAGISDDTVEFTTDNGVEYRVTFMEDDTIWEKHAYQLVIINKNKKASPNDDKFRLTLFVIIEAFFTWNSNILLYICETGDGKQAARSRLFLRWFGNYTKAQNYYFKDAEIVSEDVSNYAAIIVRQDNPRLPEIKQEFEEVTTILSNKPS